MWPTSRARPAARGAFAAPRRASAGACTARAAALLIVLLVALPAIAPAPARAAGLWRLEQPAPPAGSPFKVPLGPPGDLKFWAPNRGLLSVEGNAAVARGLYLYNGQSWRQLSTVCGGSGETARIAWAGPEEFWVVSEPSRPRTGSGLSLCHFKGGQVAGSYSTSPQASDPYFQMSSAACAGPSDCWFGGIGATPDGEGARAADGRRGAFHLHWDGQGLSTVYGGQGRAVSDLQAYGGAIEETAYAGPGPQDQRSPFLTEPEAPKPRLLHRLAGGTITTDPLQLADAPGVPGDGSDLLSLDASGSDLWAGGGGTASGPAAAADPDGFVERLPLALHFNGLSWSEIDLPASEFSTTDRLVDIAAVPGTTAAWAAVQPFGDRRSSNAKAKVARIGADGSVTTQRLPASGSGRGSAARIAFTGPDEGWLATYGGWLFHYTDGTALPVDADAAFGQLINFRPNEAAEQFVPDAPPQDDSNLFAPPPVEITQEPPQQPTKPKKLPALMKNIRTRLVRRTTLEVSFRLRAKATIALIALRKKKVVARTKKQKYKPGNVVLRLKLNRRRWPTRLKFSVRDSRVKDSGGSDTGAGSGDTVTTGGDTQATGGDGTTTTPPANGDTVTTGGAR